MYKMLNVRLLLTASVRYVTYHFTFKENLRVLYKHCITSIRSPTLAKLQAYKLQQNIYHTSFYIPNLAISIKFMCCLS